MSEFSAQEYRLALLLARSSKPKGPNTAPGQTATRHDVIGTTDFKKAIANAMKGQGSAGIYDETKHPRGPGGKWSSKSQGATGPGVGTIQKKLNGVGYKLKQDNNFGTLTAHAVKDFQAKHGLAVDGIVGPKTETALKLKQTALKRMQKALKRQAAYRRGGGPVVFTPQQGVI